MEFYNSHESFRSRFAFASWGFGVGFMENYYYLFRNYLCGIQGCVRGAVLHGPDRCCGCLKMLLVWKLRKAAMVTGSFYDALTVYRGSFK